MQGWSPPATLVVVDHQIRRLWLSLEGYHHWDAAYRAACPRNGAGRPLLPALFTEAPYDFCMMLIMVKEADLARIDAPDDYEVLDATEDHDPVQSRLL